MPTINPAIIAQLFSARQLVQFTTGSFNNNIAFRQYTSRSNGATSLNKVSASFLQANTASNFLVVFCTYADQTATASSISDNLANTWTPLFPKTVWNSNGASFYSWYAKNINAGQNNAVTVSFNAAITFAGLSVEEYSGVNTTAPIDASASLVGTRAAGSTTITSSIITTSAANDWIISALDFINGPVTSGSGWTQRTTKYNVQDKLLATAGAVSASWIDSNSGDPFVNAIIAIKSS